MSPCCGFTTEVADKTLRGCSFQLLFQRSPSGLHPRSPLLPVYGAASAAENTRPATLTSSNKWPCPAEACSCSASVWRLISLILRTAALKTFLHLNDSESEILVITSPAPRTCIINRLEAGCLFQNVSFETTFWLGRVLAIRWFFFFFQFSDFV